MKTISIFRPTITHVWVTFAVAVTLLPRVSAGVNMFNANTDLTVGGNYSAGLPDSTVDVSLTTTSSSALTISGNYALRMESLNSISTSNSYTISNGAAGTSSTLYLGNGSNFTNAVDNVSNDLISVTGTKNLTITGSSAGTLGLVLAGSGNFDVTGSNKLTISSNISESKSGSALTISGGSTGTVIFSGTNSFTGGLTVGATSSSFATLQINTANSLPTSGAMLVTGGSELLLYNPTASTVAATTYGGTTQTLTLNGIGTAANSGALRVDGNGSSAVENATWQGSASLGSDSVISVTTGNGLTLSGNYSDNGHQLQKQGAGTLTLSGTGNAATGGTQIGNGSLVVSSGSSLGSGALMFAQTSSNATTVTLNNATQAIGSLSSTFTATTGTVAQTLTLNGTALTVTQGTAGTFGVGTVATLTSVIGGTGSLIKQGAATLTLSGANTYSGGTQVNGGALLVSNTVNSATGTGSVTVGSNGSLLGTGSINTGSTGNAVMVNGTLSPGAGTNSAGTINMASTASVGALTLSSTSMLAFDIISTTSKDLVVLGGSSLALNGGTLALNLPNTTSSGINYTSMYSIFTGVSSLSGIGFSSVTGYDTTDFNANLKLNGTENDLTFTAITAVPESATFLSGAMLVAALGWSQRRRLLGQARGQ